MTVVVRAPDNRCAKWQVWASLHEGDPISQSESFILALGQSRDQAVTEAIRLFEAVTEQLQEWPCARR